VQYVINYLRECTREDQAEDVIEVFSPALLEYFNKSDARSHNPESNSKIATYYCQLWDSHSVKQTPDFPMKISVPLLIAYNRPTAAKKWKCLSRTLLNEHTFDEVSVEIREC
jgi:hypothetical protein